jgi:transposase
MGWFRISLSEDEQRVVKDQRESHPDPYVRRRMWTLWLLHCGATREQTAEFVGVVRSTVERFVREYRNGGLEGLQQRCRQSKRASELAAHGDVIRNSFEEQPVRTVAEACQRIYEQTGIRRSQTQVRKFMKGMGMTCQRVRAIPVPPKKTWLSMLLPRPPFLTTN